MAKKKPLKSKRASGKKSTKSKRASPKKVTPAKRAPKKASSKRSAKTAGAAPRKKAKPAKAQAPKKRIRKSPPRVAGDFDRLVSESSSTTLSGDLQGLRDVERAGSESVSELLEEGNAFEAGIVSGIEQAEDEPEREVEPRQVREDDVPPEYLDEN